jgi:arsenate reductase
MSKFTIFHNPRCRKSREALALLQESTTDIEIVEYLKANLTEADISSLLTKLNKPAEEVIRKGEEIYKSNFKGKTLTESEWIKAIAENPILLERPIVIKDDSALVCRPPELVNEIL